MIQQHAERTSRTIASIVTCCGSFFFCPARLGEAECNPAEKEEPARASLGGKSTRHGSRTGPKMCAAVCTSGGLLRAPQQDVRDKTRRGRRRGACKRATTKCIVVHEAVPGIISTRGTQYKLNYYYQVFYDTSSVCHARCRSCLNTFIECTMSFNAGLTSKREISKGNPRHSLIRLVIG